MSGKYKSAMTEWREELIKAAQIGDVDGTTFRALAAITIGFRADGTGFSTNDALECQNDWSPSSVTRHIRMCLDSGWLIRKNEPCRGKSSDYECAYPWEKRGINGGYPAGKRLATKREAGKRVSPVTTITDRKVVKQSPKGSHTEQQRVSPVTIPSHQDDKGETRKASPETAVCSSAGCEEVATTGYPFCTRCLPRAIEICDAVKRGRDVPMFRPDHIVAMMKEYKLSVHEVAVCAKGSLFKKGGECRGHGHTEDKAGYPDAPF